MTRRRGIIFLKKLKIVRRFVRKIVSVTTVLTLGLSTVGIHIAAAHEPDPSDFCNDDVVVMALGPIKIDPRENCLDPGSEQGIPKSFLEDLGIELISETDGNIAYRITEDDGNMYEYNEITHELGDGTEQINTTKYLIDKEGNKTLVNSDKITYEETSNEINITDELNEKLVININEYVKKSYNPDIIKIDDPKPKLMGVSYQTASGGSKVAALWWEEYSDGYAYAIDYPKSKRIKTTVWQYRDFKAAANNIRTAEREMITLGVLGITDAVWAAVKKGELLSLTLLKKVAGKFAKAIPGLGTLYSMYTYVSLCITATNAYKKIPV